jgi:predicted small lipoprotein YifL
LRNLIITASVLALAATITGCGKSDKAKLEEPSDSPDSAQPTGDPGSDTAQKKLYLDVHDVGKGQVSAQDVAEHIRKI